MTNEMIMFSENQLPFHTSTRNMYSGTSPYGHLTSKKTSPLQSPWLSPKLYSTVQITPCNKVTSALRSLLPSPVGDLNSEVPLYIFELSPSIPSNNKLPKHHYVQSVKTSYHSIHLQQICCHQALKVIINFAKAPLK